MTERLNGVDLYFESRGTAGPRVVLVHGSSGDHHNWDAVVPLLARSCRVTTYDRRGPSKTDRLAPQGSIHDDARDLAALIERLGIAPAHVIGTGSGATVALMLTVERSDLFASASLHEPSVDEIDLDKLSSFGGPLLLTHGDQSPVSIRHALDDICDALPRAQRHIFRGAGHAPHLSHADDYALVVGSFINGVHVL